MRVTLTALLALPLFGQIPYGRITGRVTDPGGALIPNASVRAVSIQTNIAVRAVSNNSGNFEIPNLIPGEYRVFVQAEGFKRLERGPLEVRVGDVLNLDLQLEIGAVTESLTVTAQAPLLESATASIGQVTDNKRVTELPLPGSNPMYLTQLTPGVISSNPPTHGWMPQAVNSVNDSVAGTSGRSSEFTLDGAPNMTQNGQPALVPPPELLQEVRVQTAPYDASVGHFTGAQINMVFKTGTNDLHTNLVFLHSSRPLATREFFTNRSIYDLSTGPVTEAKINRFFPPMLSNRYRATAGGPVFLPGFYDGRNRTFWTYGFSMVDRRFASPAFFTVPTADERRGDFSALLKIGSQYQIYDPSTITPAPNGRFSRQPLAGNIIPASRLDPMAQRILSYYPLPNVAGSVDGRNNYFDPNGYIIDYQAHIGRVDQFFSERHRLYVSAAYSMDTELSGRPFHNEGRGARSRRPYRSLTLDDVITLRPDMVLNFRYGLNRFTWDSTPPAIGFDLTKLGFPSSLVSRLDSQKTGFPEIVIEGFQQLGNPSGAQASNLYHSFAADVSHVRGTHTLRYGGEFRILQENNLNYGTVSPRIEFNQTWTKGPLDNSPNAPIGQGLASFLLGLPTGGYIDRNPTYAEESEYAAVFLHDDWKLTRKLTLNLGLRYELELPTTERYNRTNRGFDFQSTNPIQDAARAAYSRAPIPEIPVSAFSTVGGLQFAGVNGVPRGLWDPDKNNFSPRVGVAYQLRRATVVRVGYGIFYGSLGADRNDVTQQGFSARTALTPSIDNGQTFIATLSNPFPGPILEPRGASAGLATFVGRSPSFFSPQRRTDYMQRWSFSIQQELPGRLLVDLGYLGNRGSKLGVEEQYNATPARYLSTSPVRNQPVIDYLSAQVANPFAELPEFAGSNMTGRTVARSQLLKPYPHFVDVSTTVSGGASWYHSLQLRVEKRFARGYTLQAAYTWSKFMEAVQKLNPTDATPHHVISTLDRPQHLTISGVYELPFGRGRRFLSGTRGAVDKMVGGWSVQGVYMAQSGPPLGFGNILFYGADIHDIVLPRSQRRVERWFNTDAGFEKAPARQLAWNLRTFPLRLTGLRGDGYNNLDLSVNKEFRINEKISFQLRAEAQDALNHAMFGAPNMDPVNSLFGSVNSSVWGEQRRISIGGKLYW